MGSLVKTYSRLDIRSSDCGVETRRTPKHSDSSLSLVHGGSVSSTLVSLEAPTTGSA